MKNKEMRHSFGYRKLRLFFVMLLACTQGSADIQEVHTMQEVANYLQGLEKTDLAIFDIDMVLTQPDDPAFQMSNMYRHLPVAKKIINQVPKEKQGIFFTLMHTICDSSLIDPFCLEILDKLAENNIPTMALTGTFTGKFLNIESLEEWKIDSLRILGIDFSKSSPHSKEIVFHQPTARGNFPVYTQGILFVNGLSESKGKALTTFLTTIGYSPQKVLFIDDREEHLKTVESCLHAFNPFIEYIGLLFTGVNDYPSAEISAEEFEERWQVVAALAQEIQ